MPFEAEAGSRSAQRNANKQASAPVRAIANDLILLAHDRILLYPQSAKPAK